jgi:transposase
MYVRTIARRNKDGSTVRYVQLAQNVRDPRGFTKAQVLYSFGREDALDKAALRRLVHSICRFLDPADVAEVQARLGEVGLELRDSRPMGGAWLLDRLWRRIGIDRALVKLLKKRRYAADLERLVFALVANRALAPASKLSVTDWLAEEAWVPGVESEPLPEPAQEQERLKERKSRANLLYATMDFLLEADEAIQREVYWATADLLNLEVDLLFLDSTTAHFMIEDEDEEGEGIRRFGRPKRDQPKRPQVVIGLAVTREGIPVRCWTWPGNTNDASVVEQVKKDLIGWRLGRVITVVDRGFVSEENLRTLQRAGGHYIAGERLRAGKPAVEAALSRQGRYKKVRDNLEVKEVLVGDGEARVRYILVRNPAQAERDRQEREALLRRLQEELDALGELPPNEHVPRVCALVAHEAYGRYLRQTKSGKPVIDRAKVAEEARYDGRYLLRTSDDTLSAEDVALGYRQLAQIEDAFRALKSTLELRPVYHRLEDRIKAHVLLCWLALLLVRVAENGTGHRWPTLRREMQRMHLISYGGPKGEIRQRTELTTFQKQILRALTLPEPPKFLSLKDSGPSQAWALRPPAVQEA